MTYNHARNRALDNLFALLGIENPTEKQQVIAQRLIENIAAYTRSKVGH